jgi:hypothetical protein
MKRRKRKNGISIRKAANIAKKMLKIYKNNDQILDEVAKWRNEIMTKFSHIPESKKALDELEKIENEVMKMKKMIERDREGISVLFDVVYFIFTKRKIKEYRGKDVYIWIENDENVHFEFKDGTVVVSKNGDLIIL